MSETIEAIFAHPAVNLICHALTWLLLASCVVTSFLFVIWPAEARTLSIRFLESAKRRFCLLTVIMVSALGLIGASADLHAPQTAMALGVLLFACSAASGIFFRRSGLLRANGAKIPESAFVAAGVLLSAIALFLLWSLDGRF